MTKKQLFKPVFLALIFAASFAPCAPAQDVIINAGYYYSTFNFNTQCSRQVEYVLHPVYSNPVRRTAGLRFTNLFGNVLISALHEDYTSSGYDRGHLCPAADMASSKTAMLSTFSVANIAPQVPKLNRGSWKKTETLLRSKALLFDSIRIVVIPLWLHRDTTRIGLHKIAVPHAFIKLAFRASNDSLINQYFYWNR